MNASLSRRRFLKNSFTTILAGSTFPQIISASAFGKNKRPTPGDRVTIASIGMGPQGRHLLRQFLDQPTAQVIAVCDVFEGHRKRGEQLINEHYKDNGCALYKDFRKLLERDDLDAVVIATPDHWHMPVALAAVKAGKDVYVEKPLGVTMAEDQLLRKWVQKKKRIFQFGTQQRSDDKFRTACELVRNGRIGKLQKIHVWAPASCPGGSIAPVSAPDGLDYNFWLGPAPSTPYTENKCFGEGIKKNWWYNTDYAIGFIAGWGIHPLDIAYWGHPQMMTGPMTIDGQGIFETGFACNTSLAWNVHFKFHDGVTMEFRATDVDYSEHQPMNDMAELKKRFGKVQAHGNVFEGSDGWLLVDRENLRSDPEKIVKEPIGESAIHLPCSKNHWQNFVEAVKNRGQTVCPIEEAVHSNSLAQISDIATRLGRRLNFDPTKEKFANDDEANRRLALRDMRSPWHI